MFHFERTKIEGLYLITTDIIKDNRGCFMETYKKSEFIKNGINLDFCQDNHSISKKGVLRGLHFQEEESAQGKLVRCIKGKIFDVVVDIRKDSKTFGKWFYTVLSKSNKRMLYISAGFAHGFFTLSNEAEVIYKTTHEYVNSAEKGIIWNDPDLNIPWPTSTPVLSNKDKQNSYFREIFRS